jgi:large subunit ribosomal protein L21
MYAIVDIAGQQYKVEKDQKIFVHRLKNEEGSRVEFENVLLVDNNGKITVGGPTVEGVRVAAKVLSHEKGDKVLVFKKKRRKGYKKMNGHRQYLSYIQIQGILGKGETLKEEAAAPKKAKTKKETAPAAEVETAEKPKKAPAKKAAKKKEEE